MAEFNTSTVYNVGDKVSYNNSYYECLVTNPNTDSLPSEHLYWKETYPELDNITMKGYTESSNIVNIKNNMTFDMEIYGYYFDSTIEVNIPNCTINTMNITPNVIYLNVTSGNDVGINVISISKNGIHNDGVNLTLEITDTIVGNGSAGIFLTNFDGGGNGHSLWGPHWELEIFGSINDIDRYFNSSTNGTPSSNTGAGSSFDGTSYAFIETSNPNNGPSQYASAVTDNFRSIQSIEFDYHMFGSGMGDLTIQGYNGASWVTLDTLAGQQQTNMNDSWLHRTISCDNLTKVRFLFNSPTYSTSYMSDICLDNIKIISI